MNENVAPIGRYELVWPAKATTDEPLNVILDTNVVIDLEQVYFLGPRVRPELRGDVIALLTRFSKRPRRSGVNVTYGWGVTEASWRRGEGFDPSAYRRLLHAASHVLDWEENEIADRLNDRYPPAKRDKTWSAGVPLPPASVAADHPIRVLLGSYAPLLYLCHLYRTRPSGSKRGLPTMKRYLGWLATTFGIVGVYEMQIGLDLLLGDTERHDGARKMLRLGGDESPDKLADRCWAAAWDLWFLRVTDERTFGVLPITSLPQGQTLLVTRNRDPVFVRAQAEIALVTRMTSGPVVVAALDWPRHPLNGTTDLGEMVQQLIGDPRRSQLNARELVQGAITATKDVEASIGVTRSALAGGALGAGSEADAWF